MQSSGVNAGLRRRLVACGSVAGYSCAASLLLAWCWAGSVSAQLERSSLELGARLAEELADVITAPQAIVVNGQQLWIASKSTPLAVSEALDRFDTHCISGARALSTSLEALEDAPAASALPAPSAGQRTLIRRDEVPGRGGQLVCLAPSEPLTGFVDLGERLGTLFATGELGALGELRYVQARPRPEGGSHVVSVWSAGAFNLFDALPRDTDVPGDDPEQAPRPPEATRILSASIPGRSYAIRSYLSQQTAAELSAFYALEMPKQGWALVDADQLVPETAALSTQARAYTRGDALTLVVVDAVLDASGGGDTGDAAPPRATATVVQVGAAGAAHAGSGANPRRTLM